MIDETQYLSSIYNCKKRGMEKSKIENFIKSDYENGKITIEILNKAIDLLNEEKCEDNKNKVVTDLKTRIKVITDPKEQKEVLEEVKGHHKIDVLDMENNER